jgi:hypothetical protein
MVATFGVPGTGLGQFQTPYDVAVDPSGKIYVADSTGRITEWSGLPSPSPVTSWNFTLSGSGPFHMTADSRFLYVDNATGWEIFNIPSGTFQSSSSPSPVSLWGIGEDGSGNIYLADNAHDRIFEEFVPLYSQSLYANTGTPSLGVAVDGLTNVYVSDSTGEVQKFNSGTLQSLITTAGTGPGQTGGAVDDVAVDGCNRLFVDDSTNGRVLLFGPGGSPYLTSFNYAPGAGTVYGIGTDKNGDLYVALSSLDEVEVFAPQACLVCVPPTETTSPTSSPVMTATPTPTQTATSSATLTPTLSPTPTASLSVTPTKTISPTPTPTATLTSTATNSPSNTSTFTATKSPTPTLTLTSTQTASMTSTATATNSATFTITFTPTTGVSCGTSSVDLQLEEFTTCAANQSNETFEVVNAGTSAVNLNQITIKFWVDDTTAGQAIVGAVNYGGCFGSTCTVVTGTSISAVNFSPACGPDGSHQANWEVTVSNTDTAALGAGMTWSNLQTAIHLANFANFSNDDIWYSPCGIGGGTAYANDLHYAVYYQGNLVTASGGMPPSCRPNPTCTPTPPGGIPNLLSQRGEGTPTFTPTLSPTASGEPEQSVVAAPNISRGGEPIQFMVTLARPSEVKLTLFSLSGEKVYQISTQGGNGLNRIPWNLTNQESVPVASGLYIYLLETNDGISVLSQEGKVVVLH